MPWHRRAAERIAGAQSTDDLDANRGLELSLEGEAGAALRSATAVDAFPELDVRQRLSVSTGYGVAELVVHEGAELVGTTMKVITWFTVP